MDAVFYPYLIWSILQGSIEAFLSNYTNGNVSFSEVFTLLWAPRAQFWFLYALFFIFIVCVAVYSLVPKRFSVVVFALTVLLYVLPIVLPDILIGHYLSQNLVFFMFGIIFTMYINTDCLSSGWWLSGLLLAFAGGQWLFHDYLSLIYSDRGPETLLLALASILFVVACSIYLAKRRYRLLTFIGASSMGIYLMHILASSGVRVVLNKLGVSTYSMHLMLGCFVGILAPLIVIMIINR
ncbi:acyltransferase, partial [bacterium]|nr:acyltransferase [bacterium]